MIERRQKIAIFLGIAITLLSLLASASFYLGFFHYYKYREERQNLTSLERDFPKLEARLNLAVRFYPLSLFSTELGRLRMLRGLAEVEFGLPEKSEKYLDGAREALRRSMSDNPVDYSCFWELSKVYFLYNYPLLTYADKGRLLCRQAVERHPYNEFLNLNVCLVFFEQWLLLEKEEKDWLRENLQRLGGRNPGFLDRLKNKWQQNYGQLNGLEPKLRELGF